MHYTNQRKIYLICSIFLSCLILSITGCVESDFLLAEDSRLPKFINLPEGYARADVTVSLFLFTVGKARMVVRGPSPERKILLNIKVKADWHQVTLAEEKRRGSLFFSPHYYFSSYEGIEDIIEFSCSGPVFRMADRINTNTITSNDEPDCPEIAWDIIGSPWW